MTGLLALCAGSLLAAGCREGVRPAGRPEVMIGAAASLRNVLPEAIAAWEADGGIRVAVTYGATGDLRRQVEGGAPMDAVIFADGAAVRHLAGQGLLDGAPVRVATNRLVLIAPADRRASPLTFETLDRLPAGERLAIGEPAAVPAGAYAREALERLELWDALQDRLVFGGDVAGVLAYARRGEVPVAIVYATEVGSIHDVVILDEARGAWAPTPEVVAAVVRGEGVAEARGFVDFLVSPKGQSILRKTGFGPP